MKLKIVSAVVALSLAAPFTVAPATAEELAPANISANTPVTASLVGNPATDNPATDNAGTDNSGTDNSSQSAAQSSMGEVAALVIGSVVAVLAAVGAGGFFAIQQGLIQNPLPGIIPGPRAKAPTPKPSAQPAPRPANRPRYQQACSENQILQPARGADGKWLVCVSMGGNAPARWVYGPAPKGVGTAREGASCREGDHGGQDSRGRMMMCLNNQWVYGP